MLLAQVAVGNAETVVRRDEGRGAPSASYDSIVVPGRPLPSLQARPKAGAPSAAAASTGPSSSVAASVRRRGGGEMSEEYVIFDGSQALPLYLLKYEATLGGDA